MVKDGADVARLAECRPLHREPVRPDDILDEDEVTRLFAVAVDGDICARECLYVNAEMTPA